MQLALARPLDWSLRWWRLTLFVIVNAVMSFGVWAVFEHGIDWDIMVRAASEAGTAALYADRDTSTFVWSPVAAYPLELLAPVGLEAWRIALVGFALAMPTWTLRFAVLVSFPFWTDFVTGNILTPIFLSAVWALRGSKVGTFAFFVLALLRPMPLLAPLGLWILWRRPEWRWPFAGMFVAHALLVLWTGLGPEWIQTVLTVGSGIQDAGENISPTRYLGYWWLLAGMPLGAWLFVRGHVGLAGLAISNYVWFYYLYFAFPQVNGLRGSAPSR